MNRKQQVARWIMLGIASVMILIGIGVFTTVFFMPINGQGDMIDIIGELHTPTNPELIASGDIVADLYTNDSYKRSITLYRLRVQAHRLEETGFEKLLDWIESSFFDETNRVQTVMIVQGVQFDSEWLLLRRIKAQAQSTPSAAQRLIRIWGDAFNVPEEQRTHEEVQMRLTER